MLESMTILIRKPKLRKPVLIEGLPGTGFVANIATLHLITELKADKFAEIRSPAFQDLAVSVKDGSARSPLNELYYHSTGERDLIILYGNTQALTTYGQYELCGRILDVVQDLGCRLIVCMGGLRKKKVAGIPKVYCTATDLELLQELLKFDLNILRGQVTGAAGLLIGLAELRNMRGFCLLAETPGAYPDAVAAEAVLEVLCKILKLKVDLGRLSVAAEGTKKILESFGFLGAPSKGEYPGFV